jgi:Flp pilus assembly protein CpaB
MARSRTTSLDPTPLTRFRRALQPDWVHTIAARRCAAAALVLLAGVAAVRSDPDGDRSAVVVAVRDLTPGIALSADDVRIENRLATTLPDGFQATAGTVVGATLAGPVRRGEVLTDVRLLGSRLAESTAGPDARLVPLHLADNAMVDLVRAGDVVDILAAPVSDTADTAPTSRVVATDAVVVLVSAKPKSATAANDRVVLVALPADAANAVAGATLVQTVTLTLH